jgi:phage terminase large subunit
MKRVIFLYIALLFPVLLFAKQTGITLRFKPNDRQREAVARWNDQETVEIVYGGAKYGGKSFLGAVLIFHDALVYPDTSYFIARKHLNDLRKYTIPTIYEVFKYWGINAEDYMTYNGQDNYFDLYNGSRVYLIDCKYEPNDPLFERFGSMQMTRGWIEEAGEVDVLAKENLKASIGRKNNDTHKLKRKLLMTCNPKKNFLYTDFYKPFVNGTLPSDRAFIRALPDDNTYGNKDYIIGLKNTKDKVMRERLVLGNWEYDDDPNSMISYDEIVSIFTNDFVRGTGTRYITADIARLGSDKTIIRVWDGLRVMLRVCLIGSRVNATASKIKTIADKFGVPMHRVLVDEDGIGGGVVDILGCKGFVAASSPINPKPGENYSNLKAQCAYLLAEKVREAQIYERCDDEEVKTLIIEDLEQIKQKAVDDDRKKDIVSKKIIKGILNRSPDDGDTYMMRMWFELKVTGGVSVVRPGSAATSNGRSNYSM